MNKKENPNNPPTFFRRLFCFHSWEQVTPQKVFDISIDANRPVEVYLRWVCTKCNKQYKYLT